MLCLGPKMLVSQMVPCIGVKHVQAYEADTFLLNVIKPLKEVEQDSQTRLS